MEDTLLTQWPSFHVLIFTLYLDQAQVLVRLQETGINKHQYAA